MGVKFIKYFIVLKILTFLSTVSSLSESENLKRIVTINRCCKFPLVLVNNACAPKSSIPPVVPEIIPTYLQEISQDSNSSNLLTHSQLLKYFKFNSSESANENFRLAENLPICSNGSFILNSNQDKIYFTSSGYLKFDTEYHSPLEYCLNEFDEENLSVHICNPDCTNSKTPCLKKCCDLNEVWDLSGPKLKCRPSGENLWSPPFYSDYYTELTEAEKNEIFPHYSIEHPRNFCKPDHVKALTITKHKSTNDYSRQLFRLLNNGSLFEKISRREWKRINFESYCIDGAQNFMEIINETQVASGLYSGNHKEDFAYFYCGDVDEIENEPTWIPILYTVIMLSSSIFLLLTAIVYLLLWEKHNIHGWTLLAHIICLFLLYLFLSIIHIYGSDVEVVQGEDGGIIGNFCFFLAIGSHFIYLSTFCWMSLINFDLFWTFRFLKPTTGRSKGEKRFLYYFIFAIGFPLIFLITGLILQDQYGDDIESEVIVPNYARAKCFMEDNAILPYLYGPIAFLLMSNLAFFVLTVYGMHKIHKSTKFATTSSSGSRSNKYKQRRLLFIKLFIIMGVTWIFELIGWAIHGKNLSWYIIIFDFLNILQAITIFIIFVCKSEIFTSLKQKYPSIERIINSLTLKPETAERISNRFPILKNVVEPITKTNAKNDAAWKAKRKATFASTVTDNTVTEQMEMS